MDGWMAGGVGGERAKGSQLIIILPFFFLFNQPAAAEAPVDKVNNIRVGS